jgi:hypothetical protein
MRSSDGDGTHTTKPTMTCRFHTTPENGRQALFFCTRNLGKFDVIRR